MDSQFFHNTVNPVFAVRCMIEMVDPGRHPPVTQDMVEMFVILFNEFRKPDIFFFCAGNASMQPFIISCP